MALNESKGRREANKAAVRTALREAAKRLLAERGYEATTVREIAAAAGVTERTFYRYFHGKEGLITEETLAWIEILHDTTRDRPAGEPLLLAARNAMLEVSRQARAGAGPAAAWLLSTQSRPFALVPRTSPRPLLRLEDSIVDAFRARTVEEGSDFRLEVLARAAVAALRAAAIHRRRLARAGIPSPDFEELLTQAFAELVPAAEGGRAPEQG